MGNAARDREDLVKRLFAVTLSVGFASQLTRLLSTQPGASQPAGGHELYDHWRSAFLLLISLVVVVGSWDGYLSSVSRRPLDDAPRFYLDVIIVFSYLVLMLSCDYPRRWQIVLAAIFVLYLSWDALTGRVSRDAGPIPASKSSLVVTLVWAVPIFCFACLGIVNYGPSFFLVGSSTLLVAVLYRVDKFFRFSWRRKLGLLALPVGIMLVSLAVRP